MLFILFLFTGCIKVKSVDKFFNKNNNGDSIDIGDSTQSNLSKLKLDIPNVFETSDNENDSYKYYSYMNDDYLCSFYVGYRNDNGLSTLDDEVRNVLLNDNINNISDKEINGVKWRYASSDFDNLHYIAYVTSYDKLLYSVGFTSYTNESGCVDIFNKVMESATFN